MVVVVNDETGLVGSLLMLDSGHRDRFRDASRAIRSHVVVGHE
jgi:hypothetical protein